MSWPSNDFEFGIQQRLDQLEAENKKFRDLFKAWSDRPEESRKAVLGELEDCVEHWLEGDALSIEDSGTLATVVNIIKGAP